MLADADAVLEALRRFERRKEDAGGAYDAVHDAPPAALIEAFERAETAFARERLCIALAYHEQGAEAAAALGLLVVEVAAANERLRDSAAHAISSLVTRLHPEPIRRRQPGLRERLEQEVGQAGGRVERELQTALDALGVNPVETWHSHHEAFVRRVQAAFAFLAEFGFAASTAWRTTWSVHSVIWGRATALGAYWETRDDVVSVYRVSLLDGALPARSATDHHFSLPGDDLEAMARWLYGVPVLCADDAAAVAEASRLARLHP